MPLKGEIGGSALNSHGNYSVYHRKSWKNHGILFLNFCGNPVIRLTTSDWLKISYCLVLYWQQSLMSLQANPGKKQKNRR